MSLKESLRSASVEEILAALREIEHEGRPGLRYDIGVDLFFMEPNPSKVL